MPCQSTIMQRLSEFNACTQINTDILNPFLHLESISLEVFTEIPRYFFLSSTFSNYINIKDLHYKSSSGKMTKPEKVEASSETIIGFF